MKKIALIDGYGFVFRAYHSLPPLNREDGTPVGAVFGFTNMLLKLIASLDISHIAVVFDSGSKTFRNEIYPEYKAHRPPCPEDLIPQFSIIRECVEALNIATLEKVGFEADDIIATIAKKSALNDYSVLIVSSDKDLMQLIAPNISMYDAMKNKVINANEVFEKFAVEPRQVIDALALIGDSSDNVPGVKGIGPKTASELIRQYDNIENLYQNLDHITQDKRRQTLLECKDLAFLSKKLVTLDDGVELNISLDDLKAQNIDPHKLINFLEKQGFRSLVHKVKKEFNITIDDTTHKEIIAKNITTNPESYESNIDNIKNDLSRKINHIKIESNKQIEDIYLHSQKTGKIFINYQIIDNEINFINFGCESANIGEFDIYYYDFNEHNIVANKDFIPPNNIDLFNFEDTYKQKNPNNEAVISFDNFNKIIFDNSIKKIFFEAKNFLKYCLNFYNKSSQNFINSVNHKNIADICFEDINLMEYLANSSAKNSLRELIDKNLNIGFEEAGYGEKLSIFEDNFLEKNFSDIVAKIFHNNDEKINFFATINFAISQLYEISTHKINQLKLYNCYRRLELPLIVVLAQIENNGIKIDIEKLQNLSLEFSSKIKILTEEIFKLSGQEFNIASSKQLAEILFNKLKIDSVKKSKKTKEPSTNAKVLEELASQGYEIANKIIEYRKFSKLKNTYCDALPKQISAKTNRIHTNLSNTSTLTGRLNSVNPNLQNIPIKSLEGKKIRECFIAKENNLIISADYSQIELRVLAHLAQLPKLLEAFHHNKDIHKITASEIFNVLEENVSDEMRSKAKAINFGIIYGISAFGLARQLKISNSEASNYIKSYFEKYPGIKEFMNQNIDTARRFGFVETISGRKCFIHDINNKNPIIRQEAERQAINAPIQGSSADIIKKAMIQIHRRFINENLKSKLILQIHDELLVEANPDEIEIIKDILIQEMTNSYKISVDLKIDFNIDKHW